MPQDYDVEWAANRLEWWIITAEGLLATKPTTSSGLIKERHTSPPPRARGPDLPDRRPSHGPEVLA